MFRPPMALHLPSLQTFKRNPMKRKFIHITFLAAASAIISLVSCDKIYPPYMNVTDVSDCSVPDFPADTHHVKTVLLEEFTGHKCINCPEAAFYIHQIKQDYGEKIITLAIHAGGYATPDETGDYALDLTTDIGTDYNSHFSINSWPRAMFNRDTINNQRTFGNSSSWDGLIAQIINQPAKIFIQIINDYDNTNRKLCTHVKVTFLEDMDINTKLVVLLAEDSISGFQKNNNTTYGAVPDISNYIFNDVLRESFNSAYGENLTAGGVLQDSAIIKTYKKFLPSNYIDRHCKVIAYVYNSDTEEIIQTAERHVE